MWKKEGWLDGDMVDATKSRESAQAPELPTPDATVSPAGIANSSSSISQTDGTKPKLADVWIIVVASAAALAAIVVIVVLILKRRNKKCCSGAAARGIGTGDSK